MAETLHLDKDEYLFHESEESTEMYYLSKGTLAVLKRKGNGEQQIGTIYSGELVGEMSFLDTSPRSASIKAVVESELTIIPHSKIEVLLQKQPPWFRALIKTLLERLRKTNTKVKV